MYISESEETKIGVIGQGKLADLIRLLLRKANFSLGGLENETGEPTHPAMQGYPSPRVLAGACPIIFTILSDGTELEKVLLDDTGIARCWRTGTLVIDMSTVSPEFLQELSEQLVENEVAFLDAAIINESVEDSGVIQMILVGGEEDVYERALPIFKKISKSVKHLGPNGASQFYRQAFAVRKRHT